MHLRCGLPRCERSLRVARLDVELLLLPCSSSRSFPAARDRELRNRPNLYWREAQPDPVPPPNYAVLGPKLMAELVTKLSPLKNIVLSSFAGTRRVELDANHFAKHFRPLNSARSGARPRTLMTRSFPAFESRTTFKYQ